MRKLLLMLFVITTFIVVHAQTIVANDKTFFQKGKKIRSSSFDKNIIPFDLNGGLIFFEALLNGVSGTFILDTGSPGLLINEKANDSDSNAFTAVGVSGGLTFYKKKGNRFVVGGKRQKKVETLSADLSHLEKVKKQRFTGMVGHQILKQYELCIDYQKEQLQLLEAGESKSGYFRKSQIPFVKQQHFVVVQVEIEGELYNFGIDTGAEVNVMDQSLTNKLSKHLLQNNETISIRGVNKDKVGASIIHISELAIHDKPYEKMPFVVMNLDNLNAGYAIKLDGLLGFPFLSSEVFSIDYENDLIHYWAPVPLDGVLVKD